MQKLKYYITNSQKVLAAFKFTQETGKRGGKMNVKHIAEKICKNLEDSKIWQSTCDNAGNF